jgi:transposase-like protein
MGREWTDEQRDEQRRRMQNRSTRCEHCGATNARIVSGAELDQSCHFPGIMYKVCPGCGHESVVRSKRS